MNEQVGKAVVQTRRLVATYRVRQAQQAVAANNLEVAQDLLALAGPDLGPARGRGFAWNYVRRRLIDRGPVLAGHEATVGIVEGSPDARTLASGDESGAVRLWDLETGVSHILEPHHKGPVRTLSFSLDGRSLASTAQTVPGEVYLWDATTGKFRGRVRHVGPMIYGAWFTTDGTRVVGLNHAPFNHPHRLVSWSIADPETEPMIPDAARLFELGLADPRLQAVADLLDGKDSTDYLRTPRMTRDRVGLPLLVMARLPLWRGWRKISATIHLGRATARRGSFESRGWSSDPLSSIDRSPVSNACRLAPVPEKSAAWTSVRPAGQQAL